MNRNFDELFERAFRNPFALFDVDRPATASREPVWFQPHFDVEETEEAYLLSVDVPGVKKEDIKIDVNENVLSISGERKDRKFQRSFTLPATVHLENVEAHLEDGVLRIALPKSEQAKPRTIQVQTGKGGFFSKLIGSQKETDKEH